MRIKIAVVVIVVLIMGVIFLLIMSMIFVLFVGVVVVIFVMFADLPDFPNIQSLPTISFQQAEFCRVRCKSFQRSFQPRGQPMACPYDQVRVSQPFCIAWA